MKKGIRVSALVLTGLMLVGCSRWNGSYYYDKAVFAGFDPNSIAGELPSPVTLDVGEVQIDPADTTALIPGVDAPDEALRYTEMTVVVEQIPVYATPDGGSRQVSSLSLGQIAEMRTARNGFLEVRDRGTVIGFCPADGVAVGEYAIYGELPIEYGEARTERGTYVPASSHLVDVTRYTDNVIIAMQLSTEDTSIGEPFYHRNLCMMQYDTVQKLLKAIELFAADGYTVKIYDAYRPTSVQQRWFDIIKVHKWVADPSVGMGGRHDRGCAIDMSLVDANGKELVFPTPMHTFSDAAARSAQMSAEARKNVDYMTKIMVFCGFDYINSEWWHFQDTEIERYLPTDHPIDEIPLVAAEK